MAALVEREMVRNERDLAGLCEDLRAAGRFALDTEFVGERTYVPRLCLVQVATTEFIALIDPLAVGNLQPLWNLICDPRIEKVLHAAREDLRLAFYGGGRIAPVSIFDTQVIAGLIGMPFFPISYARLVEAIMGVRLDKGETRSEWDRRPLSPDQLRYARDDVRYLLPIADRLKSVLKKLGRMGWVDEEMRRFSEPLLYEPDPELAYLRIRGSRSGLGVRQTTLLQGVAAWREREAAARDVPARSLLRDEVLTEIALRPPRRLTDFAKLRGFPAGEEVDLGPGILQALDAARALPEDRQPAALAGSTDEGAPQERALADLLYALGSILCLNNDIAPELALSKAEVTNIARGGTNSTLLTGWRWEAIGQSLSRLAAGTAAATIRVSETGTNVEIGPAVETAG